MAFVITEPCIDCKDQSCVAVCPVDCIHPGILEQDGIVYDQFFIDPVSCIDCGLCEPECPVDAIFGDDEVPAQWSHFIQSNADFFKQPKL
jgi:ferredoxin